MQLRVLVGTIAACLIAATTAHAQALTDVIVEGNYSVLGGETITASAAVPAGFEPVNDEVAFVYDPDFHFFMRGYLTDPAYDRRDAYRDVGYVVVAAAGDPGGNYRTAPTWITHTGFEASFADGHVSLSYAYNATYVPTRRGYQSFLVYTNLRATADASRLYVYDDELRFGRGNYLLTGDGPEQGATLELAASDAAEGERAIAVHTGADAGGSHWKLMLFANGHAAGFAGIDLRGYDRLVFHARASRDVVLVGGFGTADDSGSQAIPAVEVSTEYRRFEIDLSQVDRTDINTPFWIFAHRAYNPGGIADLSVHLDGIELVRH
jgi:hypothetical protein